MRSLVTFIVEVLLQILSGLFLGLPGAVLSLLKTWRISASWELLGLAAGFGTGPCLARNAGEGVCCALGTAGFKSCGSPTGNSSLDLRQLMNCWHVWKRIRLGFGCKTFALWKKSV